MGDFLDKDALEQAKALETGDIGAEELMRMTLDRIAAVNGEVNAIVSMRDPDALIAEARAADNAPRKGWMHGLPLAVKDLADAEGLPTSRGSPIFEGEIARLTEIPGIARRKLETISAAWAEHRPNVQRMARETGFGAPGYGRTGNAAFED